MELITIGEIENVQSVSSPHEKELKDFGEKWVTRFRGSDDELVEEIAELVGGEIQDLGLNEEWTITKEFFPEVRVHLSYYYYGKEFSQVGEQDSLRFLFSGERVKKLTGEDLAGMIETLFSLIDSYMSGESSQVSEPISERREVKHKERREALECLDIDNETEISDLANFLGAHYRREDSKMVIDKKFFPGIGIEVEIGENLNILFKGSKLERLTNHDLDKLAIYISNHIIRFITEHRHETELPAICKKVFPQ